MQVIIDVLKELIRPESKEFKRLLEMQNRGTGPLHESMALDRLRYAGGLLNSDQAEILFDGNNPLATRRPQRPRCGQRAVARCAGPAPPWAKAN